MTKHAEEAALRGHGERMDAESAAADLATIETLFNKMRGGLAVCCELAKSGSFSSSERAVFVTGLVRIAKCLREASVEFDQALGELGVS